MESSLLPVRATTTGTTTGTGSGVATWLHSVSVPLRLELVASGSRGSPAVTHTIYNKTVRKCDWYLRFLRPMHMVRFRGKVRAAFSAHHTHDSWNKHRSCVRTQFSGLQIQIPWIRSIQDASMDLLGLSSSSDPFAQRKGRLCIGIQGLFRR